VVDLRSEAIPRRCRHRWFAPFDVRLGPLQTEARKQRWLGGCLAVASSSSSCIMHHASCKHHHRSITSISRPFTLTDQLSTQRLVRRPCQNGLLFLLLLRARGQLDLNLYHRRTLPLVHRQVPTSSRSRSYTVGAG
jgi:hypothetical protein